MPEKTTLRRAEADKRAGKSPSTQAGEFVREEMHHVREGKHGVRSTKQATKPPTAVVGHEADVMAWPVTANLDYEAELAVIIGKQGRDIPKAEAYEHVFGYTVMNDVTARDLQRKHQQWFKGKSLDTFAPLGPWIVHKSALPDPHALRITLRVNGETRQEASTGDMVFRIEDLIETLSAGMTLEPGDILATGTPSGVAAGMDPPRWLKPGDVVEAEVEGIGVLRNRIVAPRR